MKILITGSNGMLGNELCDVFAKDHEVVGVDVTAPNGKNAHSRVFYEVDITVREQVAAVFEQRSPELVIHAAAWTDVDGCEQEPQKAFSVNVTGTRNIAEAAYRKGSKVVYLSTDFVFDGEKDTPYRENDAVHPLGIYGKTKLEGEKLLGELLSQYVVVRTSWLYGKNGKNFVDTIIAKGKSEEYLRVVSDQVGSPTYTGDLAEAIKRLVLSLDGFAGDIFHVSNLGYCSWYDLAARVLRETKGQENIKIEPITSAELARPASRPRFSALDNAKFQKISGYKMRPWEDALSEYLCEKHGVK